MELQHRFTVPAGVDATWEHFNDIQGVAACFPGATVTESDAASFTGTVKVKLGPIALVYNGSGTFVEKDEAAHRLVIDARGKDKRGNGTAGALVTATLTESGADTTEVDVHTDLSITGKAAQFGRGNVIKDVSDKLLGQFVDCLEQRLTSGGAAAAPAAEPPAEVPPEPTDGSTSGAAATTPAPEPEPPTDRRDTSAGVPPPPPAAPSAPSPGRKDDALDLGSTVLPVLLRAYWKPAVVVLVVLLFLWWALRRG